MKNILIVDDEITNNELISEFLKYASFNSHRFFAKNGQEGLKIFKKNKPDLVIMDHQMPIMDGIEALKEMRKLDPKIPIIMVSGDCSSCKEKICQQYHATKFFAKPIKLTSLLSVVNSLLDSNDFTKNKSATNYPRRIARRQPISIMQFPKE